MHLFNRLYKYRQSDLKHQKENFLTEIFAYCLKYDEIFRRNFLNKIGFIEKVETFDIDTQRSHKLYGRPDVYIEINKNTIIIIECKVESTQEKTQLERYHTILSKEPKSKNRYLILTKYYEETWVKSSKINFKHLRWYEIYSMNLECTNEICKELANYLKEEKMDSNISFLKSEIGALKSYNNAVSKMKEFIERINEYIKSIDKSLKNKTIKKIERTNEYGSMIVTRHKELKLWVGFWQYDDDDEIQLGISIDNINTKDKKYADLISRLILEKWQSYSEDEEKEDKNILFKTEDVSIFYRR